MKTPRKILEAHHAGADARLEQIQAQVLAETLGHSVKNANEPATPGVWRTLLSGTFWADVFLPARRIWLGCSLAWALMILVNMSMTPGVSGKPVSAAAMASFQERERVLAELTLPVVTPVADRPKTAVSQPQSRRKLEIHLG